MWADKRHQGSLERLVPGLLVQDRRPAEQLLGQQLHQPSSLSSYFSTSTSGQATGFTRWLELPCAEGGAQGLPNASRGIARPSDLRNYRTAPPAAGIHRLGVTGSPYPGQAVTRSQGPFSADMRRFDELQDASRGQVLLVDPDTERRERVLDRVHDRGRRDYHAALPHAAEVDVGVEWHRLQVLDLDPGNVTSGRQEVVHERRGPVVAVLVVRRSLEQHSADALRDAAPDLALDHGGVDERTAVLNRYVPLDFHDARLG